VYSLGLELHRFTSYTSNKWNRMQHPSLHTSSCASTRLLFRPRCDVRRHTTPMSYPVSTSHTTYNAILDNSLFVACLGCLLRKATYFSLARLCIHTLLQNHTRTTFCVIQHNNNSPVVLADTQLSMLPGISRKRNVRSKV
jgi:hypothetical protein